MFFRRAIPHVFVIFYCLQVHGQVKQYSLMPYSVNTGDNFIDMFFSKDGRHGWMCGDNGRIYKTADGGVTWVYKTAPTGNNNLASITFLDDNLTGWAVGLNGYIVKTTDGGEHWSEVYNVPVTSSLFGVSFFKDGTTGVVVSTNGDVIVTNDGGDTWETDATYDWNNELWGVTVLSKNKWIVFGQSQFNVFANNKWNYLLTDEMDHKMDYARVNSICTYDGDTIWAGCTNGFLMKSNNGGVSWQISKVNRHSLRSVWLDRQLRNGWYVTSDGAIFKSNDGGKTWQQNYQLIEHTLLNEVQFDESGINGWVCGNGNLFMYTTDGGVSWKKNKPLCFYIKDSYLKGSNLAVAGDNGNIIISDEKMQSWKRLSDPNFDTNLQGLNYSAKTGKFFAVGDSNTIVSVNSDGTGWKIINEEKNAESLSDICFDKSGTVGYCLGTHSMLFKTEDGGLHWSRRKIFPVNYSLYRIVMDRDFRKGMISGSRGALFLTEDGGNSWQKINFIDSARRIISIDFDQNFKNGFLITAPSSWLEEPHIYQSFDGGRLWSLMTTYPGTQSIMQLIKCSPRSGEVFITCSNGDVYRSLDFGLTWFKVRPFNCLNYLWTIQFDKNQLPIFAGRGGVVINQYKPNKFPIIRKIAFKNVSGGYKPVIEVSDADNLPTEMEVYIRYLGNKMMQGVNGQYKEYRISYSSMDSIQVWPNELFRENTWYAFKISISDGWNIRDTTIRFLYGEPLWSRVKKFMHWDQFPKDTKALSEIAAVNFGMLALLYSFVVVLLFFVQPKWFVLWHEAVANSRLPFPEKLSKYLVFFLIENRRSLDAFVDINYRKAITLFESFEDVKTRSVWIPAPFEMNHIKFLNFSRANEVNYIPGLTEIRDLTKEGRVIICIEGQGGVGKSTLAFQIARWARSDVKQQRLFTFRVLPVFINNLTEDLDQAVVEKLKYICNDFTLSDTLAKALLKKKRVMAIVDGVSEMNQNKSDKISPEKGASYTQAVVYTSRRPVDVPEKLLIIPLGLKLEFLDNLLDGFTNEYVGAFKFGEEREVLRNRIKKMILDFYRDEDGFTLPLGLLRLMVDRASAIVDSGNSLSTELPNSIDILLDQYLETIFRKDNLPAETLKSLRLCAVIAVGGQFVLDGAVTVPETIRFSPQWIPASTYLKYVSHDILDVYFESGVLIQSGPVDDIFVKFTHDPIAEYLFCKELIIRKRDHLIDERLFASIGGKIKSENLNLYLMLNSLFDKIYLRQNTGTV